MAATVSFDTPISSSDQSFDRVLKAGLPIAAIFWSGTQLDPALDSETKAIAKADAGKLLVVKIKKDDNPELVRRFNVRVTPTLLTLRGGSELTRIENPSPAQIREHVNYLLGRGPQPAPTPAPVREQPAPRNETRPGDGKPVIISDATWTRDVLQSSVPVVVDFWAPWCGPCRMVAPALEQIAADYSGRLRVAKMNVDENPNIPMQLQVQGIPTMVFVKNGQIVDRVVGALPAPQIRARVEKLLTI